MSELKTVAEDEPIAGLSDVERAALKGQFQGAKLYAVEVPDEDTALVFRKPSEAEFSPLINGKLDKAADRKTALTQLAMKVVVWPSKETVVALFAEYPGLSSRVAAAAMAIASGEGAEKAKKL
jgi:hypothetical protein